MKTFIQASEIWVPSRDRTVLEFQGGLYGPHTQLRAASERMCFGYDEGLPGKAWAARHPIILKDLQHSYFKRAGAAREAGLSCAVALPIFAGDYLLAVVVMFCSADEDRIGAIELWHNDPDESHDMGLVDGYYGVAENFEFISRRTLFRPGFGLPGMVWESGMPVILSDLWNSERFLRKDDARKAGLSKGLGLPVSGEPGHHYVMTFLSAMGTPIARRFEVWVPLENHEALVFDAGHCDSVPDFAQDYATIQLHPGDSPISRAWMTGIPEISESVAEDSSAIGVSARKAGLETMLALPVLENGQLKAVVAFYF
jgi:hypothetical protein